MFESSVNQTALDAVTLWMATWRVATILRPVSWQDASVFAIAVALAAGCAEHLGSLNGPTGWSTGVLFWPPPAASASWIAERPPDATATFGDEAAFIEGTLHRAGYADLRWFPIGARHEHGFAVTTRLERIDDQGTPKPPAERWISPYPEAANLRWLTEATEPYLPAQGRYRVLLVAFTDLHVRAPGRPWRWDEGTAMEGADLRASAIPTNRRIPVGFRVGVYLYDYAARSAGAGALVSDHADVPALTQIERSGLSALAAGRASE
jgi:hypothetical protein